MKENECVYWIMNEKIKMCVSMNWCHLVAVDAYENKNPCVGSCYTLPNNNNIRPRDQLWGKMCNTKKVCNPDENYSIS